MISSGVRPVRGGAASAERGADGIRVEFPGLCVDGVDAGLVRRGRALLIPIVAGVGLELL